MTPSEDDDAPDSRERLLAAPPWFQQLHAFLEVRGIPGARVQREAPVSRRQWARWKIGKSDICLKQMMKILRAVRLITGEKVAMQQIINLEPDDWPD